MAAVAGLYGLGDDQRGRHRRGQANAERSESRDDNTEA
ncbi:jg24349, partial [Pararge aegeria aegeria]